MYLCAPMIQSWSRSSPKPSIWLSLGRTTSRRESAFSTRGVIQCYSTPTRRGCRGCSRVVLLGLPSRKQRCFLVCLVPAGFSAAQGVFNHLRKGRVVLRALGDQVVQEIFIVLHVGASLA